MSERPNRRVRTPGEAAADRLWSGALDQVISLRRATENSKADRVHRAHQLSLIAQEYAFAEAAAYVLEKEAGERGDKHGEVIWKHQARAVAELRRIANEELLDHVRERWGLCMTFEAREQGRQDIEEDVDG